MFDTTAAPREPRILLKTSLTLTPGANGTKKLVERYGNGLVCVRYCYDPDRQRRLKTVELIEEESTWMASRAIDLVKIRYDEVAVREKAKEAGARWNGERKLWAMSGEAVRRLGMEDRVVTWLEPDR